MRAIFLYLNLIQPTHDVQSYEEILALTSVYGYTPSQIHFIYQRAFVARNEYSNYREFYRNCLHLRVPQKLEDDCNELDRMVLGWSNLDTAVSKSEFSLTTRRLALEMFFQAFEPEFSRGLLPSLPPMPLGWESWPYIGQTMAFSIYRFPH